MFWVPRVSKTRLWPGPGITSCLWLTAHTITINYQLSQFPGIWEACHQTGLHLTSEEMCSWSHSQSPPSNWNGFCTAQNIFRDYVFICCKCRLWSKRQPSTHIPILSESDLGHVSGIGDWATPTLHWEASQLDSGWHFVFQMIRWMWPFLALSIRHTFSKL